MATITIDTKQTVKKIKPMHAGGQPPVNAQATDIYFHYLTEAGIPYSRLHDVGGAFGGFKFVDVPNIFRDFNADVDDPASYDFTFTDLLMEQLHKAKVEPYFRLGVTIENASEIKAYWVHCPTDMQKWARICEHIILHYTKGWANGYHYNITYWEIWNEPDNTPHCWTDTPEKFYEFYTVAAKYLKEKFPDYKIGGYGASGFYTVWNPEKEDNAKDLHRVAFFRGFLAYIKAHNAPIDFFSWHHYGSTKDLIQADKWVGEELARYGFAGLETHLNEWDPYANELGTAHHSAEIAATMIAMQNGNPQVCCIYDMRTNTAPYCPLFNPITHKPIHGYYSLAAFNMLYQLGMQVKTDCDTEDLYVLAATDGKRHAMLISNLTKKKQALEIEGVDLTGARYHVIDQERLLSWSPAVKEIANNMVLLIEW